MKKPETVKEFAERLLATLPHDLPLVFEGDDREETTFYNRMNLETRELQYFADAAEPEFFEGHRSHPKTLVAVVTR